MARTTLSQKKESQEKKNKKMAVKEKKMQDESDIKELELFYNTGQVSNILTKVEEKKKELVAKMIEFSESHKEIEKVDDDGEAVKWRIKANPLVISNYFFKPIAPITNQEPEYNAEELGIIFDFYCQLVAEVNDKIGNFPSSLTSFCKFAGITLSTLRKYKSSTDYGMRVVAEKIYDQIGDENITMSQMGIVREKTTLFKMKSQNEMVEKAQPQIRVNVGAELDKNKIISNLNKYKELAAKKGQIYDYKNE